MNNINVNELLNFVWNNAYQQGQTDAYKHVNHEKQCYPNYLHINTDCIYKSNVLEELPFGTMLAWIEDNKYIVGIVCKTDNHDIYVMNGARPNGTSYISFANLKELHSDIYTVHYLCH